MTQSTARNTATLQYRQKIPCHNCGATINIEEAWKKWIRNNPHLDSQRHGIYIMDTDMWVHKFGSRKGVVPGWNRDVQYLMKVEVKTRGAVVKPEQQDTITLVDNLLRTKPWKEHRISGQLVPGHPQNVRNVFSRIAGRNIRAICHGVHILRMSGESPGASEWLLWDERPITAQQLEQLFRYELDPDSLRIMEHREHKPISTQQPLFTSTDLASCDG